MTRTALTLALAAVLAAGTAPAADLERDLGALARRAQPVWLGVWPGDFDEALWRHRQVYETGLGELCRRHGLDFVALAPVLTAAWLAGREEEAASMLRMSVTTVPYPVARQMALLSGWTRYVAEVEKGVGRADPGGRR